MKNFIQLILVIAAAVLVMHSCEKTHVPKPRGYFRIELPDHSYQQFTASYPFLFEYPEYAQAIPDTSPMAEPYWLNIVLPSFRAEIHLSYKAVNHNLFELTEDSRSLTYKHTIKASAIDEHIFVNEQKNVYGTIYEIKGNAASPMQFHLTDSVNHFVRGSFYIREVPNYDSLRPVIMLIEKDIYHFIETLTWN